MHPRQQPVTRSVTVVCFEPERGTYVPLAGRWPLRTRSHLSDRRRRATSTISLLHDRRGLRRLCHDALHRGRRRQTVGRSLFFRRARPWPQAFSAVGVFVVFAQRGARRPGSERPAKRCATDRGRARAKPATFATLIIALHPPRKYRAHIVPTAVPRHEKESANASLSVLVLLVVALSTPSVFAQSQATTGVIEGTVTDEKGRRSRGDGHHPEHRNELRACSPTDPTAASGGCCCPSGPTGSAPASRASRPPCARASTSASGRR